MEQFDWLEGPLLMKEELKFVLEEHGEPSAQVVILAMGGAHWMPQWCVAS